jgi:predicted kinase
MPYLVFVLGSPAVGKSRCAKLIARRLGAAYLDKDTIVTGLTEALLTLAGTDPHGRDENRYYQDHVMDLEYETLLKVATDNLQVGLSVVMDAPFGRYVGRPEFVDQWARTLEWDDDVRPVVVRVDADDQTIRARMASRGLERDMWKLAHWDDYWRASSANAGVCAWRHGRRLQLDNSTDTPDIEGLLGRFEDDRQVDAGAQPGEET